MKISAWSAPMKIDRHSQAKILTPAELQLLFSEGFTVQPGQRQDPRKSYHQPKVL